MQTYKGIGYSVQKLPEGLYLLVELGGVFQNKLLPLKSNNEKEIRSLIDKYLNTNNELSGVSEK